MRVAVGVAGALVLAFLVVPVLSVIPMSFSSSMVFELIPTEPGLTQYRRFFASPEWMVALGRSVQLSDEPLLADLQRDRTSDLRIGAVIEQIVLSPQFRQIRAEKSTLDP